MTDTTVYSAGYFEVDHENRMKYERSVLFIEEQDARNFIGEIVLSEATLDKFHFDSDKNSYIEYTEVLTKAINLMIGDIDDFNVSGRYYFIRLAEKGVDYDYD